MRRFVEFPEIQATFMIVKSSVLTLKRTLLRGTFLCFLLNSCKNQFSKNFRRSKSITNYKTNNPKRDTKRDAIKVLKAIENY